MKREEVLVRRLVAEIQGELEALQQLNQEIAAAPAPEDSYALRARGSILHDFYSGVERIFVRIARELNGGVPQDVQWHRQLVKDMTLAIPDVRPQVIDADLAKVLDEYLCLRYLLRHVHGFALDSERLHSLTMRLPETLAAVEGRLEAFTAWLLGRPRTIESRADHAGAANRLAK